MMIARPKDTVARTRVQVYDTITGKSKTFSVYGSTVAAVYKICEDAVKRAR